MLNIINILRRIPKKLLVPLVLIAIFFIGLIYEFIRQNEVQAPSELGIPQITVVAEESPFLNSGGLVNNFPIEVPQNIKFKDYADSATIYEYTPNKLDLAKVNNIITTLGMTTAVDTIDSLRGRTIIAENSTEDQYITFYVERNSFNYTKESTVSNAQLNYDDQIINKNLAILLEKLDIPFELYIRETEQDRYFTNANNELTETTNISRSDFKEMYYYATFEDRQILDKENGATSNTLTVRVNKNNEIVYMTGFTVGNPGKAIGSVRLKSKEKVIEEIKNREAKIIEGSWGDGVPTKLTVDMINHYYYAYQNKLIPVFMVTSTVDTNQQEGGVSFALLDAIINE